MRIVSLHPACTEWVASFGALNDLVGRSHACRHPSIAPHTPVVTAPSSKQATARSEESTDTNFVIEDEKLLANLNPDILLALDGAPACDFESIRWGQERKPAILRLGPTTYKEVLDSALRLGTMIGRLGEAMRYVGETEKNLMKLQRQLASDRHTSSRPTVVCIEAFEPLRLSGRWVPDLVELAGGRPLHHSTREDAVSWNDVLRLDPDVLAIVPPDEGLGAARRAADHLSCMPTWKELRAARAGRIFAFDGAPFALPGPRLYRAIELLAAALHPGQKTVTPQRTEMARVRTSSLPAP